MNFLLKGSVAWVATLLFLDQIYRYLMDGLWKSRSVVEVLSEGGSKWAASPQTWKGVHNILDGLNFSVLLFLLLLVPWDDETESLSPTWMVIGLLGSGYAAYYSLEYLQVAEVFKLVNFVGYFIAVIAVISNLLEQRRKSAE